MSDLLPSAALEAELQAHLREVPDGVGSTSQPRQGASEGDPAPGSRAAQSSRLLAMNMPGLMHRPVSWLALAGFMGTGKSRIGWELSRELSLHFVDTDKLIARVVGKSIPEVFAEQGEGYFRSCESEIVRRVTRLEHAVVSLGGGTFIHEANRRELLRRGPVVVLTASPETVYARTRNSDRPLLRVPDPLARISELMAEREQAYGQGTIHVHSDGRPSEEIVAEIVERLWDWQDAQTDSAQGTEQELEALDLEAMERACD
ncbi:shikimate kinase [Deinococcus sp.]|uniref:shikimate kinase n=1 Tax=Deinococcus sp. TaxID=47478 RepID=UPI0025E0D153|nr:shikimate kinase [Deinococcus sp.]